MRTPELARPFEKTIALEEKRKASFHEAAHAYVCFIYGGYGIAKVWRNSAKNVAAGQTAWRGRFELMAEPGTVEMTEEVRQLMGVLPAPKNWKILIGMAGVVAESMADGVSNPDVIFEDIQEKIYADEVSQTDLELIGKKLRMTDVSKVVKLLAAGWETIERNAKSLTK